MRLDGKNYSSGDGCFTSIRLNQVAMNIVFHVS